MQSLVSILIPAYNAERWVAASIKSALNQRWPRKEVIVVDDGSSDRTLAIAQKFASEGVSVVAQPHRGAAASRNHALALSGGDYIQWLDADDLLAPDKIQKQMEAAERFPAKRTLFSGAWARFYFRTQRAKFSPTAAWRDLAPVDCILHKMNEGAFIQTCAWLVSRELTEAAGPWDTRLLGDDDGEYFSRVMLASDGIVFVPDAVSYWRITGPNSLSYIGFSKEKLVAHFLSMQLQTKQLRSNENSARARAACLTCLQAELLQFYPEFSEIVEQMQAMAAELGGKLSVPHLSWKYAWMRKLFGWHMAKRAKFMLPNFKRTVQIRWDQALFRLENWKSSRQRPSGQSRAPMAGVTGSTLPDTQASPEGLAVERSGSARERGKADTTH